MVTPGDRGPQVRVFVQTRGTARATDYAFLGGAPPEPWWRAYRDATAFDHPTVLVTSDGAGWAAYLSGIPSSRVDAVGTVVRYTLVLDGPCGAADAACVPAAVGGLARRRRRGARRPARRPAGDGAGRPVPRRTTSALARPAPAVPRRPPTTAPRRRGSDERRRRRRPSARCAGARWPALAALARCPPPAADEPGDWIGAVGAPAPRAAFTARVAALVDGAPGRALLLNLVGGAADARPAARPRLPRRRARRDARTPSWRGAPRSGRWWRQKKRRPAARRTRRTGTAAVAGIAVLPVVAVIGMLAMTVLVVTLLVWLL